MYKPFERLRVEMARLGDITLDRKICCLDFYDLLRRRDNAVFVAFDIRDKDGRDLRDVPLVERKCILHAAVRSKGHILCPDDFQGRGIDLYREVCGRDLEGIVAKWKYGPYRAFPG